MLNKDRTKYIEDLQRSFRAVHNLNGPIGTTSQNTEIRNALTTLRSYSRQAVRNDPHVAGYISQLESQVIGEKGITMQIQLQTKGRGSTKSAMKNKSEEIEYLWKQWARQKVDTSDSFTWSKLQRLVMRSIAESGEIIIRKVKIDESFRLELIEADQLDENYDASTKDGSFIFRMGIGIDKWRRRKSYALLNYHPGDIYYDPNLGDSKEVKKHVFIDAKDVLHIYKPLRPGQLRGIPWTTPVLELMANLSGYIENTSIRARATAGGVAFITSTEDTYGDAPHDREINGQKIEDIEPGTKYYLRPGESIQVPDFHAPAGEHETYVRSTLMSASTGVGLAYESLAGDYTKSNYSSSRMSLIRERDNLRIIQALIVEELCQPIFQAWLEHQISMNKIYVTPNQKDQLVNGDAVSWRPRGFEYVDPQKDIQASKLAIEEGFKSRSEIVASLGGDYENVMQQQDRDRKLRESYNLPDPTINVNKNIIVDQPEEQENDTEQSS